MALRLNGSSSGYVELDVPAAAGSHTLTLPDGGGSSGQYLQTNGSGALSWATVSDTNLVRSTAAATTSGTAHTFTGLPSTTKRIQVLFDKVSNNSFNSAATVPTVRLGTSGGIVTTGYDYLAMNYFTGSNGQSYNTNGTSIHPLYYWGAEVSSTGIFDIVNINSNTWVFRCQLYGGPGGPYQIVTVGKIDLGGTLDRVQVTTEGGTATFDNGQVNLIYEVV
jgi:hypothetical protein